MFGGKDFRAALIAFDNRLARQNISDQTSAAEFYERLFQLDTSLRPLFKEDLTEQKMHLIMMLKFAVGTLD